MSSLRLEDNSKRFPILVPLMKEKGTFEFSSYWCKIDLDPIQIHGHISWLSYCNVVIFGFVAHAWVKKEYRLRAALSSLKTSPMDYGQIIWSPVGARMFVLEKIDRRAAPNLYTYSRNRGPSFGNMMQQLKWGLVIETHNALLCIIYLKRRNFAPYMQFAWNSAGLNSQAVYRGQIDANSWPKLPMTVLSGNSPFYLIVQVVSEVQGCR